MTENTLQQIELSPEFPASLRYVTFNREVYGVYYSPQSESVVFPMNGAPMSVEITDNITKKLERRIKFEANK